MANAPRSSGILILLAVIILGTLTFLSFGRGYLSSLAGVGSCVEALQTISPSPGRKHIATLYYRYCGEAVVTHVNLTQYGQPPAEIDGLVRGGEVFQQRGQLKVDAAWMDDQALTLNVPGAGASGDEVVKTRGDVQVRIRRAR